MFLFIIAILGHYTHNVKKKNFKMIDYSIFMIFSIYFGKLFVCLLYNAYLFENKL